MSYFEEGDEARGTSRSRPRRPSRTPRSADQQTLLVRRAIAAGGVLLILILIVVGVRGCLSSQKKRSLRDYNRNVAALVQESDTQVGKPLFEALSGGGASTTGTGTSTALDLQNTVNQLRVTAEDEVKRTGKLDTPGDMTGAQQNFLTVLELRRDAISKIADKLPTALGKAGADTAIGQITGQMQAFLASDVLYSQRVMPLIQRAFDQNGVTGQTIAKSQFLPDISWLDEPTVAERLGASLSASKQGPAAGGTHDLQLTSTTAGDIDMSPDTPSRIPADPPPVFNVQFQNAGENDETNVNVKVTITGPGVKTIVAQTRVPQIAAGESTTVDVQLESPPPIGKAVTITVGIDPVAGETEKANSSRKYPAIFGP